MNKELIWYYSNSVTPEKTDIYWVVLNCEGTLCVRLCRFNSKTIWWNSLDPVLAWAMVVLPEVPDCEWPKGAIPRPYIASTMLNIVKEAQRG